MRRLIEARLGDLGIEFDAAAQIEAVRHMVQVFQNFMLLRIPLGPLPLLQQGAIEGVAIDVAVRIAAAAGVAVPVPGSADPAAGLEPLDGQAYFVTKTMDHVQSAEAGADDDGR